MPGPDGRKPHTTIAIGQTGLGAAMDALAPLIRDNRLRRADLYRTVEELRLPARFFAELTAHLGGLGVSIDAHEDDDDGEDDAGFDRDGLSVFLEPASRHRILTAEEERDLAEVMAEGRRAHEWLASGRVPEHAIADLERKVRAGDAAADEFARCNFRLVVSIASKVRGRGLDLEDLIQEGHFGLVTAVRKFDPHLGTKFSTYATLWIRQTVQRAIADRGNAIRLPVHMHERVVRYVVTLRRLHAALGRSPTKAELAETLDWTVREVNEAERASRLRPESLDRPLKDRLRAGDLVADRGLLSPEEAAVTAEAGREVRTILASLFGARPAGHRVEVRPRRRAGAHPRGHRGEVQPDP